MKEIYLDYAAATPIDPRVLKAMEKASLLFANPSSFNDAGRAARRAIEESRKIIADFIGARPEEIIFTSSGSEANNLALTSTLAGSKRGAVLTSPIEHISVLDTFQRLGLKIKMAAVDHFGFIDLESLKKQLSRDCQLVSVMYANNEIGSIEPVKKISKIIADFNKKNGTKILFHVDACQATLFLDMNVQRLGVDLLSFDGSKIYGPRGIGGLYIKRGTSVRKSRGWLGQEKGLKTGTENTPAIIGLAKAISFIDPKKEKNKLGSLQNYAFKKLKLIPNLIIDGPLDENRLPNNIHVCLAGFSSEELLLELDKKGVRAGSGSACTSYSVEPSHVLKAIGVDSGYIDGAIRFSIGRQTNRDDIDYLVDSLLKILKDLKKRYQR